MKLLKIKITGTKSLMMNNPRTVNPFDEYAKEIKKYTSKRQKTEDDQNELFRLKFLASLYYRNGKYYLPLTHLWRSLVNAAKENKQGSKFERSVFVQQDLFIDFPDKDKTPEQLWGCTQYVDIRDAGIMKKRIPCVRAIFNEWSTEAEIWYDETQLDKEDVIRALDVASVRHGIGTYRLLYGRFEAKEI